MKTRTVLFVAVGAVVTLVAVDFVLRWTDRIKNATQPASQNPAKRKVVDSVKGLASGLAGIDVKTAPTGVDRVFSDIADWFSGDTGGNLTPYAQSKLK